MTRSQAHQLGTYSPTVCNTLKLHTEAARHFYRRSIQPVLVLPAFPTQFFQDGSEMAAALKDRCPSKIDIGPVYNVDPQRRAAYQGQCRHSGELVAPKPAAGLV